MSNIIARLKKAKDIENAMNAMRHFSYDDLLLFAASLVVEHQPVPDGYTRETWIEKQSKRIVAQLNAQIKLDRDPKQLAKKYVHSCWDVWQKKPSLYKSKAAFAREVISHKQCDNKLKDTKTIEGWCREWEQETVD